MELFSWIWDYAIPFLFILTVLVFVHELGHYLVARWNGVRVEVFSIGFGRELFGWDDTLGTRWKISLIPLGGYVRMFGDEDASSRPSANVDTMSPEEQAVSFYHKKLGQRSAVVFAGPFANFLFAIVVLSFMFATVGQPFSSTHVTEVIPESAADTAGLRAGDRITHMAGRPVGRFEDVQMLVQQNPLVLLEITVMRDSAEVVLTATPDVKEGTDNFGNPYRIGLLGIRGSAREYTRHNPLESVARATMETYSLVGLTLNALSEMVTGKRSTDELGGPLRIAQMSGEVSQYGWTTILWFLSVLSINLGLINLFPIPLLDGGHLLYFAAEAIRGKPLGERAQEYGFRIGLMIVLSLMVFVTWNDLMHLRFFSFLKDIIS
jgi:regulator of sigma E protease